MFDTIQYVQSSSTVKPKIIESNFDHIYLRTNIKEILIDGVQNWEYDEAYLTVDEFNQYMEYLTKQNAINGVNDSSNITSILSGQQVNDFNQLAIMEAIVELFEMLTTMQTSTT